MRTMIAAWALALVGMTGAAEAVTPNYESPFIGLRLPAGIDYDGATDTIENISGFGDFCANNVRPVPCDYRSDRFSGEVKRYNISVYFERGGVNEFRLTGESINDYEAYAVNGFPDIFRYYSYEIPGGGFERTEEYEGYENLLGAQFELNFSIDATSLYAADGDFSFGKSFRADFICSPNCGPDGVGGGFLFGFVEFNAVPEDGPTVAPVPLPAGAGLLALGLGGLWGVRRVSRRA